MTRIRMHADEVFTDVALVRRLLAAQFPRWADLTIEPVPSYGTDHDIYRLGVDLRAAAPDRLGHRAGNPGSPVVAEARAAPAAPPAGAPRDGATGGDVPVRLVGLRVAAR